MLNLSTKIFSIPLHIYRLSIRDIDSQERIQGEGKGGNTPPEPLGEGVGLNI